MAVHCPKCGKKHTAEKFYADKSVKCACGFLLDISMFETVDDFLKFSEDEKERAAAEEIQEDAVKICQMILDEQCEDVDIEIAKSSLEKKVESYFPDKIDVYRMIYEARFRRLWEQFRTGGKS